MEKIAEQKSTVVIRHFRTGFGNSGAGIFKITLKKNEGVEMIGDNLGTNSPEKTAEPD